LQCEATMVLESCASHGGSNKQPTSNRTGDQLPLAATYELNVKLYRAKSHSAQRPSKEDLKAKNKFRLAVVTLVDGAPNASSKLDTSL